MNERSKSRGAPPPRALKRREVVCRLAGGALLAAVPLRGFTTVYLTPEQARAAIFPGQQFESAPIELTEAQARAIERRSGVRVRERKLDVWRTQGGAVVIVDRVLGKHEFITYACGIDAAGAVKQIEILEYRETYGDEVRDARWRAQFAGKRTGARLKLDDDIRNISGATLSCRHVTDGVKRLLATFEVALHDAAARTAMARHVRGNRSPTSL